MHPSARLRTRALLLLAGVVASIIRPDMMLFDVLDQTASVKVRAFWGTNYLLPGRFDGRWMITHVQWQSPPVQQTAP